MDVMGRIFLRDTERGYPRSIVRLDAETTTISTNGRFWRTERLKDIPVDVLHPGDGPDLGDAARQYASE